MDITYQYLKKRCTFGRQPMFSEQGPEVCDSIPTDPSQHKSYILRNPVHEAIQHAPVFSKHDANTIRAEFANSGVNHSEGGWPKDVPLHDPEATQRYRRKIEKEDNYCHCVMQVCPGMAHYIMQNNAIDMYRTYFSEIPPKNPPERTSCRTVNVYRDVHHRPVASLAWQVGRSQRFAATYVDVDFDRVSIKPTHAHAAIWDIDMSSYPVLKILAEVPIFDLRYSPRDADLLAGGLETGQVAFWDQRAGGSIVAKCPEHVAHRDITRQVLFIASKSGQEIFSSGPDGCCKWWDMRNLENPTDEMIIDVVKSINDVQSMATAYGVSVMEYEPTIPTRFMVGTENGLVVSANRKGKSPLEKLSATYDAHLGPVCTLQRNPAFPKVFLTSGDYTFRVFSEDCRESPIVWCEPQRHAVRSAQWSPTRLSLITVCCGDGNFQVWDLLRHYDRPVVTTQISKDPLTVHSFDEKGSYVSIGTKAGDVFLVELSASLTDSDRADKSLLSVLFERESKRERILESRLRELKLKMRQAEEGSAQGSATDVDAAAGDRDIADATAEFFASVKKDQASLYS